MRAMILAAGRGTRLRPLTELSAKPAVPVVHRPVAAYILPRLLEAGIHEVVVNSHHLPQTLVDALTQSASKLGLSLSFVHEEQLLGTGGGIRNVASFFGDEASLILNGDFLFDVDLRSVVESHRLAVEKGALATLVLRQAPDAESYGVFGVDTSGRVLNFIDLASQRGEVSVQGMFTGVHILEPELRQLIPESGAPCILRSAYLQAFKAGAHIHSYFELGQWRDIGNPQGYLQANFDVLDGALKLPGSDPRTEAALFLPGGNTRTVDGVNYVGPCSVSHSAKIGEGAVIGPYAVVGEHALVGAKAKLARCVLWPGVAVAPNNRVESVIQFTSERRWPI